MLFFFPLYMNIIREIYEDMNEETMQCDICCKENDIGSMYDAKSNPIWICIDCHYELWKEEGA